MSEFVLESVHNHIYRACFHRKQGKSFRNLLGFFDIYLDIEGEEITLNIKRGESNGARVSCPEHKYVTTTEV